MISTHEWPPSSLRCMPQWFCWYRRSLSTGDITSLWTQYPISGFSRGQSARSPLLRGVQLAPSSVVSKIPYPWMTAQKRDGSSGCGMIAGSPRWPGGCLPGSFQSPRPGWPSSVLRSDQVAPPSRLSNTPAASAPASSRPCAAVRPEIFESLRPLSSYESPSLESSQRLSEIGAAPDTGTVPLARRGGVDGAGSGVVHGVVDRPALAVRARARSSRGDHRRFRARSIPCGSLPAAWSTASRSPSPSLSGSSPPIRPHRGAKVIGPFGTVDFSHRHAASRRWLRPAGVQSASVTCPDTERARPA